MTNTLSSRFFAAFLIVVLHASSFVVTAADHRNLRFMQRPDTECPVGIYPKQGAKCQAGLVCEYDYTMAPTILQDGTCTEPLVCVPKTSVACGDDGYWTSPEIVPDAICLVNKPPKGTDIPCTPASQCPEEMPQAGTKCETGGLLCKYEYVFTPSVNADGSCSENLLCGPPARIQCGDDGMWGEPIVLDTICPKAELSANAYEPCFVIQPIDETCPTDGFRPIQGGRCQVGLSCDYDYIYIPAVLDGACTGMLTCRPTTNVQCSDDGFWEFPTAVDFLSCEDLPVGAYQTCDANTVLNLEIVYTECPAEISSSVTGERCEAGLSCGYDYAWLPTVLDGGMCQEPVSCAPKITIKCGEDGVWGDVMMQAFACFGVDLPDITFTPCEPIGL